MNKQKRTEIFGRLQKANPAPTTELNYSSNFELLIAVILSAQATDISVNKATATLFKAASTPKEMLKLGIDGVRTHIKSIGLFNTKAANVIKTCRALVDRHQSEVPTSRTELESLPGSIPHSGKQPLRLTPTSFGFPIGPASHRVKMSWKSKSV